MKTPTLFCINVAKHSMYIRVDSAKPCFVKDCLCKGKGFIGVCQRCHLWIHSCPWSCERCIAPVQPEALLELRAALKEHFFRQMHFMFDC